MNRLATTALAAALFLAIAGTVATVGAAPEPQKIRLTVKRFAFSKSELHVKKGVPVVIEISSIDRLHGFSMPDFGVRGDVTPGQITRIEFTPEKTGQFAYFCDIFCGEGHENVDGVLVVEE
jgi:cytochrome c oxidase subunit 2